MSLYNMIYGANPATFFILPMLGKHPDEYPRFRDCFVGKISRSEELDEFNIPKLQMDSYDEPIITVYTRTGGGNREEYVEQNAKMSSHPNYIKDYDDSFDSTFALFEFSVPEKWKNDYDLIKEGKLEELSEEYKKELYRIYPKLNNKFGLIFSNPQKTK